MPPQNSTSPATPPPIMKDPAADNLLERGEQKLTIIHRHLFGLIFIYLEALGGVIALGALIILVSPHSLKNLSSETDRLLVAGVILAFAILIFFLFVATHVYRQSRLIITDKSLVQVMQKSLFFRDVSRLSFSNVEDVSSQQRGILPTIFNYGTLEIQTAGEMDNFVFPTCPSPDKYAHEILEARQTYAQGTEDMDQRRMNGRPL